MLENIVEPVCPICASALKSWAKRDNNAQDLHFECGAAFSRYRSGREATWMEWKFDQRHQCSQASEIAVRRMSEPPVTTDIAASKARVLHNSFQPPMTDEDYQPF